MKFAYKTIISLLILILFLSAISLFKTNIYDKVSQSSVYSTDYVGYSRAYRLLDEKGYSLKIEASDSTNISYLGSRALWAVFSPAERYSDREKERLKEFVERGGLLMIADRFDSGRELAGIFGISVSSHELVDYASFNKRQDLPVLPAALNSSTTYSLVYKFPSAVENYPKETKILSKSSRISFIDSDDNGKITSKDYSGPFPVAVVSKYEKGQVIFFSDPNVFSNDLIGRKDNSEFLLALVAFLNPSIIIFDESHAKDSILAPNSKFFVLAAEIIKDFKPAAAIILLVIISFLAWKYLILPGRRKKEVAFNSKPTDYLLTAQKIIANSGNDVYVRRWVVLMGYSRIKKNILAKMQAVARKDISKEELLANSGFSGKNRDDLSAIIDLGMSLERGESVNIDYRNMKRLVEDIQRLNSLLE